MRKLIGTAEDLDGKKLQVYRDDHNHEFVLSTAGIFLRFTESYWDFTDRRQGPGGIEQLTDLLEESGVT